VPDVSGIGDHRPREISAADRAAVNDTLPRELDREKLWAYLEPMIKETRSLRKIIDDLNSTIQTLEISTRILTQLEDQVCAQRVQVHLPRLRDALRYHKELIKRRQAEQRWKKFRITRAWLVSGGKLTVKTPDNPEGEHGERRGRGTPSGAFAAHRIICGKDCTPETVKAFVYRNFKDHSHIQLISAHLQGSSDLRL
jgi:hypothetical protein